MFSLKGKVALVTGASQGIGRAIALALSCAGASVVLAARNAEKLQGLAEEIGAAQGVALPVQMDVGEAQEVKSGFRQALDRFGRLDVVVVNAGIVTVGSVERGDPHAFEQVINVNLLGAWRTVRAVLPHVIAAKGYIIFVSSLAGTIQGPLHAAYNSSKAGLQAFANTLRLEVQGLGVDIGTAHLFYTDTETGRGAVEHPLIRGLPGIRMMKPSPVEETAAMLVRGMEHRSRTIVTPAGHLALLVPDVFQLAMERLALRNRWASIIHEQAKAVEREERLHE